MARSPARPPPHRDGGAPCQRRPARRRSRRRRPSGAGPCRSARALLACPSRTRVLPVPAVVAARPSRSSGRTVPPSKVGSGKSKPWSRMHGRLSRNAASPPRSSLRRRPRASAMSIVLLARGLGGLHLLRGRSLAVEHDPAAGLGVGHVDAVLAHALGELEHASSVPGPPPRRRRRRRRRGAGGVRGGRVAAVVAGGAAAADKPSTRLRARPSAKQVWWSAGHGTTAPGADAGAPLANSAP